MTNENTIRKALIVQQIVDEHYQPGEHSRSKHWVYRKKICPQMPMSVRTFFRLLRIAKKHSNQSLNTI